MPLRHFPPPRVAPRREPERVTLRRVSVYLRTVRYERDWGAGCIEYGPTFPATVLEWERAVD